jgi:hypothetical protein
MPRRRSPDTVAAGEKHFRLGVLSALFTYGVLLAAGALCRPVYDYMFTEPLKMLQQEWDYVQMLGRDRMLWYSRPARSDKMGVIVHEAAKTYGDYTFFSTAAGPTAKLVDLQGKTVHEWTIDWQKIWADPADRRVGTAPLHQVVTRAFLQPDGSVYALFTGEGGQMGDFGLVKVDRDSKVIWKYSQFASHDISVMTDGNILTFIAEFRYQPHPAAPLLKPPYVEPFLAVIDGGDGHEIRRLSVLDLFAASPLMKFLWQMDPQMDPVLKLRPANGDIFHPNTMTRITAEAAARNPVFKEGDYLLSFRNFSLLVAADLNAGQITWASYGPWRGQHSPRFMADGSIVMFDNLGNLTPQGGLSRILNIDPATDKILWEYDGAEQNSFYSAYNAMVDPLPNGNILVTETEAGRIFEVTRDKEIVWDYRALERVFMEGENRVPSLFSGRRFRRDDLPFLDKN